MQIAELHATRNFGGISARTSASLTRLNGQSARTRVTDQSIGSEVERSESWPGQVELFVSPATVKTHVAHILQKLSLRDRVQAVVLATSAGWCNQSRRGIASGSSRRRCVETG